MKLIRGYTGGRKPTLVLGGTGRSGRRVAQRLWESGRPIRIGSRTAEPPFDWQERTTWAPALRNVGAAYISHYPDLAVSGAADAIRSFTELALANGVRRLVMLSRRGEEEAQRCEQVLRASGAEWTILRSSWFCQSFSESFLADALFDGEIALPAGSVAEPFVDAEDIADAAVAALTQDGHAGQLYELTGPRLLTFAEAVAEIAAARRRAIRFEQVSPERFGLRLAQQDIPPDSVSLVTHLFTTLLDGRNAHLADGVQRALRREPRDFTDYARDTAATGVWGGQVASMKRTA